MIKIDPNLRNPLSLFALCFIVIESIFVVLLMYRVENIVLSPCLIKTLLIFVVAFPSGVFLTFILLLIFKPRALYSRHENAVADYITNGMTKQEVRDKSTAKDALYDAHPQSYKSTAKQETKVIVSEDAILKKYISSYAPYLQQNIKVETRNGVRYFDGYANWNGCYFVVEVKCLQKWAPTSIQGVRTFVSSARSCFSSLHMTLLLYIEDNKYSKDEINREIHSVDPSINVVFADKESNGINFSNI